MTDYTRYVENRLNILKTTYPDIFNKWLNKNTIITEERSGIQMHKCEVELL